jgi:hypothetical protein
MTQKLPSNPSTVRAFLAWVWAALLIAGGGTFLLASTGVLGFGGPVLPLLAAGTALLAAPFFARWLVHRGEWWAALTAWVFVALAILLLVMWLDLPYDQIIGALALLAIAAPFGGLVLFNRRRWWALIPAYALTVAAVLLLLTILHIPLPTLGAVAIIGAALPFWLVYMKDRMGQWWAIIPAAALSGTGAALLALFALTETAQSGPFWIILNGLLAAVFLGVFLTMRRFDWAIWVSVGFALGAVLAIWFPQMATWGVPALALGVYIAFRQIGAGQKIKAAAQGAGQPPAAAAAGKTAPQPAQAAPATPPPPAPAPPQPQAPAAPTPTAPAASPGLQADQEATAGLEARGGPRVAGRDAPPVEFRPLDPFKARREQQDTGEEE